VIRPLKALVATAALASVAAFAQPVHTGGAMATRSVSHYLALEREVQQAVATRDSAALQARVSGDFTYRAAASADLMDRDAWMAHETRRTPPVRDLTVSEQDGVAVVSFLAGRRFIVDTWKGGQLVARSASLAADAPKQPRRPSGRE
jgi:hypothetical protein